MNRWITSVVASLAVAGLLGCATTTNTSGAKLPEHLLVDALFAPPDRPIDVAGVFTMSPAMHRYVVEQVEPLARRMGWGRALMDAMYTKGRLKLEYDSERTRNAAEAFDARAGNCLSLVIMTGAFAKALGLEVHYQNVEEESGWDRNDDLQFFIGHINVRLGRLATHRTVNGSVSESLTIDFLPGQDLGRQRVQEIAESRVLAMYFNNRAAEALVMKQTDESYAWLREALRTDPGYSVAYNTLGVVYLRRGALREAEATLRHARALEPANPHVLGNLALALQRQGRDGEALALLAEQKRLQPVQPFAMFREGLQAMREGRYEQARQLFERELSRAPDYHEFHFWLAQAHLKLGDAREARRHLEQALENSTTKAQHAIYQSKLQRLKAAM